MSTSQNNKPSRSESEPSCVDVAIVTILPESYAAIREIFKFSGYAVRNGYEWAWGKVESSNNQIITFSVGSPLDRENIAAATFVTAMIDSWTPKNLLLVDIAGGISGRDNVQLGDVVTHTVLHYYDYHKVNEDDTQSPRHLTVSAASTKLRELSRRSSQRNDESWINKIPCQPPKNCKPKILSGEMLVGGAIQANSKRLQNLISEYSKAIAVEMEGVGVARAILDSGLKSSVPDFLIVRGISDFCNTAPRNNQKTRDLWKEYAAATAAAHAYDIISQMFPSNKSTEELLAVSHRFSPPDKYINNLWETTRSSLQGRGEELNCLKAVFSPESDAPKFQAPHVIWGEAGVGKSSLAREVAEQIMIHYKALWWIDASDLLKIRFGLREFSRKLGIPSAEADSGDRDTLESYRFLSDLREFLESRILDGRVLIILDNIDDAKLKHELNDTTLKYLPRNSCDVLITSQSSHWESIAETSTPLKGLALEDSIKLVAEVSERPELIEDYHLELICRYFDGRPLFLKQIASLLRDGDDTVEFWTRLRNSTEEALEILPEIEGFNPLWRKTYSLSIERANNARFGSIFLLEIMAFFAPEPIPLKLLHAVAGKKIGLTSAGVDAVLRTLVDRSLLDCQKQRESKARTYTLHRVISALVRTIARENDRSLAALEAALTAINLTIPSRNDIRSPKRQQIMALLAPHIEVATSYTVDYRHDGVASESLESAAEAASMLGLYHRTLSEWTAAEHSNRVAVDLSDKAHNKGCTALRKIRLANVIRQRAKFDLAEVLLEEALPELKKYGDIWDYAWGLTVQARIFRHRPDSNPNQALVLLKEAMKLLENLKPEDDLNKQRQISELHGYISVVSRQLSDLNTAELESLKGLQIITQGMSPEQILHSADLPDEPLLAIHLRALGGVWRLREDLVRAMGAHKQALSIFERIYGANHIDVCRALDSLGRVQREWGDLNGALDSFNRATTISNLQFGLKSPHAGTAAVNRALVYLELQDPRKAFQEAEVGLEIYCYAYKEHLAEQGYESIRNESTAWALFVRANALFQMGDLAKSHKEHCLVLDWRNAHYSLPHALIASSYYALGDVLWAIGTGESKQQALIYHHQAMNIREQVFGKQSNYWLAQSQSRLGQLTENIELLRAAYITYHSQLKSGHWRTQEVKVLIDRLEE